MKNPEYADYKIINFEPTDLTNYGTLKLAVSLQAETIQSIEINVGFMHRATEKIAENKLYNQNIPYLDRLSNASSLLHEHAYVLAIEKLLKIRPPLRAQYIRVMFDEIVRIASHLLWLGNHAADLGTINMFFYCLNEREALLDCCAAVAGSRIYPNYYCAGGVMKDLPHKMPQYKQAIKNLNYDKSGSLLDFIWDFTERFPAKIDEYENLLTDNKIWQQRTRNVGILSPEHAVALGCSGAVLRSTGIAWDLRKQQPYEVYNELNFNIPVGNNGDCYDRYLIRIAEMRESNKIIRQTVIWLKNHLGPVILDQYKFTPAKRIDLQNNIGSLIHNFKFFSEGYCLPRGDCYAAVEDPKGEFGIYLVSDGANKPYRLKIRSASFPHLAALSEMVKGHKLDDLITILGSQDLSIAEVDR